MYKLEILRLENNKSKKKTLKVEIISVSIPIVLTSLKNTTCLKLKIKTQSNFY